MAEGRRREAWNHTAQVLALMYNLHRNGQSRPLQPRDFHPMAVEPTEEGPPPKVPITALRDVFIRDQPTKP